MKITKTSSEVQNFKMNKTIANKDCYICPCCGKKIEWPTGVCKTWYGHRNAEGESLFTEIFGHEENHHYRVDCYSCLNCGAEWESEPYIYA